MADNETIADIIAWLRKPREGENAYLTLWRDEIADRLEAAHKCEIEATAAQCCQFGWLAGYGASEIKHQQEPVGDAAKLREALEDIGRIVEQIRLLYSDYPYETHLIARKASAALAAPPRNCDRFQTTKQAKEAYFAEVRHVSVWDGCETERLVDWLLCTAT